MIVFNNVSKKYGQDYTALENVSFTINKGDFAYLVGPTGSGKTTIFRLIIRDLIPSEGTIQLGDWELTKLPKKRLTDLRRSVGVIFQDLKLLMDRTILENVMLPLQFAGIKDKDAQVRAQERIAEVGLMGNENKFPLQLSGGERQRVAIARALVFDPQVILADEPTGNLDINTSFQIVDLLTSINKSRGTTILMATHNEEIIKKSERIIGLERGKLAQDKNKPSSHLEKNPSTHKASEGKEDKKEEKKHAS